MTDELEKLKKENSNIKNKLDEIRDLLDTEMNYITSVNNVRSDYASFVVKLYEILGYKK